MTKSPIFFKLCEIKVSLCSNKVTEAYDPLFRNTRENRDNTWEKIFEICNVLYLEANKRSRCVAERLKALLHSHEVTGSNRGRINNFLLVTKF